MELYKGLNLNKNNSENGEWVRAKNVLYDSGFKAIRNEPGFKELNLFADGEIIIGVIPTDSEAIIFTIIQEIQEVVVVPPDGILNQLVNTKFCCYRFNSRIDEDNNQDNLITTIFKTTSVTELVGTEPTVNPIDGVYKYNHKGELIIAWCNGNNEYSSRPCILNVDNPAIGIDPDFNIITNLDKLYLTAFYDIPTISLHVKSGGYLLSGSYSFAIKYVDDDLSETDTVVISNYISVIKTETADFAQLEGNSHLETCNKRIEIDIDNLDGRYKKLKLYCIKSSGGTISAEYVGEYDYSSDLLSIVYSRNGSIVNLDEVNILNADYSKAGAITKMNNELLLADVSIDEDIKYQKYANMIKVFYDYSKKTYLDIIDNSYKNPDFAFEFRGYMPNEVCAFYVRFVLNNGRRSKAFHIPGRAPVGTETDYVKDAGVPTADDTNIIAIDSEAKNFEYYDTTTNAESGELGYWENDKEYYPDGESDEAKDNDFDSTVDYNGDAMTLDKALKLSGNKVRHHKFPSLRGFNDNGIKPVEKFTSSGYTPLTVVNSPYNRTLHTGGVGDDIQHTGKYDDLLYTAIQDCYIDLSILSTGNLVDFKFSIDAVGINAKFTGYVVYNIYVDYYGNKTSLYPRVMQISGSNGILNTKDFQFIIPMNLIVVKSKYRILAGSKIRVEAGYVLTSIQNGNAEYHSDGDYIQKIISTPTISVYTSATVNRIEGRVLSVVLKDVVIPDSIADKVKGIELLYAKRTYNNMTTVGQTLLLEDGTYIDPSNIVQQDGAPLGVITSVGYPVRSSKGVRLHPFDLMVDKPTLNFNYLNSQLLITVPKLEYALFTNACSSPEVGLRYRILRNLMYFPENNSATDPDNTGREECIHGNINADLLPSTNKGIHLVDLKRTIKDVYFRFFEQELVSTGYIKLIEGNTSAVVGVDNAVKLNTEDDKIYGGDTYLNLYGLFTPFNGVLGTSISPYYFPVYSIKNIGLRYSELGASNQHYPKFPVTIYNSFLYENDHSLVNELYEYSIHNPYRENIYKFENRIIRSLSDSKESTKLNWRTFPVTNYHDLVAEKGRITNIDSSGKELIINTILTTFIAELKDLLRSDINNVYLGSGDIFDREPVELIFDNEGVLGCTSKVASINCKHGHIFVDKEKGNIILYGNRKLELLNDPNVKYPFKEYMKLYNTSMYENPYTSLGIVTLYDDKYDRFIISFKSMTVTLSFYIYLLGEFVPLEIPISYMGSIKEENIINMITNQLNVYEVDNEAIKYILSYAGTLIKTGVIGRFADPNVSEAGIIYGGYLNVSHSSKTFSYSFELKKWISEHDYNPDAMFNTRNNSYAIINQAANESLDRLGKAILYKMNGTDVNPGLYFPIDTTEQVQYESYLDVIFNVQPDVNKIIEAIFFQTRIFDSLNTIIYDDTIDKIMLYTNTQCSGYIDTKLNRNWFDVEKALNYADIWYLNNFRDIVLDPKASFIDEDGNLIAANLDISKNLLNWYHYSQFLSTFVVVRMLMSNTENYIKYIETLSVKARINKR